MNVTLGTYTENAWLVCAVAARTCYSPEAPENIKMNYEDAKKLLSKVIRSGHHSVLEHAVFTFEVSGISRAATHQLVRHRMASYSQQSQRYCKLDSGLHYVVPESIVKANMAWQYKHLMREIWELYDDYIEAGVPPEDARYILPNATVSNIVVTMNARELLHFFSLRLCNNAQWEIRELANKMYEECMKVAPELFETAGPNCWNGGCTEMKPCGNPPRR